MREIDGHRQVRPAGFEPATKGFEASPRFREARTISPSARSIENRSNGGRALYDEEYCWDSPR